jgi:hypothetical protein
MDTYEILVPFMVEASSERMAIRKLENALTHTNRCPVCAGGDEAGIAADDPRQITGHWDFPIPASALGIGSILS